MNALLRRSFAGLALLALPACARDNALTATADSSADLLASVAVDPTIAAEPGQASVLGITMEPTTTFEGELSAAAACTYSPVSKRVECPPVTRNGLTYTRSIAFFDAAGTAQPRRDDNTRATNTRIDVAGNVATPRGALAVVRSSDLTVAGLGRASTAHTLNGLETGRTSGTLTTDRGAVVMSEEVSSKTENVVVPAPAKAGSWPLSGSTTRAGTTSATRPATNESRTSSWSEKVTFTGTSVVNVVVTRDGKTKTCTRDLAAHTSTCG
jgi:hypothetical protein